MTAKLRRKQRIEPDHLKDDPSPNAYKNETPLACPALSKQNRSEIVRKTGAG
jgi:hypothetical protein